MKEEEKVEKTGLQDALDEFDRAVEKGVDQFVPALKQEEVGHIKSVGQGIVWAGGLGKVQSEELVTIDPDISGMVLDILPDRVGIILFGPQRGCQCGEPDHAKRPRSGCTCQ